MLNFQLRSHAPNETLAEMVMGLYRDERLCIIHEHERKRKPKILCSLRLKNME